jgi:hypothetical protein
MENPPPANPPEYGALDMDFMRRVYRTSLVLILLVGGIVWEGFGPKAGLGWLVGSLISLIGVIGTDLSVKRFINPDSNSVGGLLGVSCAKLLVMILLVIGTFVAAKKGWINLLWALPGFAVPHAVILLKLAGQRIVAMNREAERRDPR